MSVYVLRSNMGCCRCSGLGATLFLVLLFFFVAGSSLLAEGRSAIKFSAPSKGAVVGEADVARVERIGSRPPRCDRKCSSCGPCEAIQVPTNPQENKLSGAGENPASPFSVGAFYSRDRGDDDGSNYKPMSWKCKCGRFIFNP